MHINDISIYDPYNEGMELGKARCSISPINQKSKKQLHRIHDRVAGDEPMSNGAFNPQCSNTLFQSAFRR